MLKIKTNNYDFSYIDIKYVNSRISISIELLRWIEMKKLKSHIIEILNKYKLKPIKKDMEYNINNVIARILFESYSVDKIEKLEDGLFNILSNSNSLLNDIKTTFTINNVSPSSSIISDVIKEIDLQKKIKSILYKISECIKNEEKENITINKINKFEITFAYENDMIKLKIPYSIYTKLKKRYTEFKKKSPHLLKCQDLIICLMLRYDSLNSLGNQMGMPIPIKNKFKICKIGFEGFASALNHNYKYYCSMFYDIEKYFMSLGPYQNITYSRGIYLFNPPYEKILLNNMINNIIQNLNNSKKKLAFVFGTPTWDSYKEVTFHNTAKMSKYYKKHT